MAAFPMPNSPVTCTYTNTRTQNQLQLQKVWVNGLAGDTAALTITGGLTNPATATSTAPAAPVAGNTASTQALSGAQVTVAEAFGAGNAGSYGTSLTCTGGVTPNAQGQFTMPNSPVVCTFTNSRSAALVTLQKTWVDGLAGDTAALSITGGTQVTPNRTSTSDGQAGSWTDPVTVQRSVLPGASVTVAEVLGAGNVGSYGTALACTGGVTPNAQGQFTMPNAAVVCTFTNSRLARVVTLQKTWVDGLAGDTAALSVTGGTQVTPNRTSTSDGQAGSWTDPVTVQRSVLPGAPVTVAEVLGAGNVGSYGTALACTGGVTPNAQGQFTMPNAAVVCTFTNSRLARVVTLQKTWVDGLLGDTAALSVTGGTQVTPNRTSTSDGQAGSWTDPVTVQRSVLPGAPVTVAEVLGTNVGSYGTSLSCTGGVTPNAQGQFTMPNAAVTCTYTNTRTQNLLELEKVWVNGLAGDTAALTITGGVTNPATDTSTAPDAPAAGNTASTPARSGAPVTVVEERAAPGPTPRRCSVC